MKRHHFDALGTHFRFECYSDETDVEQLFKEGEAIVHTFDNTYSRFKKDSLIAKLERPGTYGVPHDLVQMLRQYNYFYNKTSGKMTPTIGSTLVDLGYDNEYSLVPQQVVRAPVPFPDAIEIIDHDSVRIHKPVVLDLGALGKGYVVDRVYALFLSRGVKRFMVDGSGDTRIHSPNEPLACGLEDPRDNTRVLGVLNIADGSLCASALNRRTWRGHTHYVDPATLNTPQGIVATFVHAKECVLADALSTALFFVEPEEFSDLEFEYAIISSEYKVRCSKMFTELSPQPQLS